MSAKPSQELPLSTTPPLSTCGEAGIYVTPSSPIHSRATNTSYSMSGIKGIGEAGKHDGKHVQHGNTRIKWLEAHQHVRLRPPHRYRARKMEHQDH